MEAMARDLSNSREQRDVLQAQVATLLEEREDETAAPSNDRIEVSRSRAPFLLIWPATSKTHPSSLERIELLGALLFSSFQHLLRPCLLCVLYITV